MAVILIGAGLVAGACLGTLLVALRLEQMIREYQSRTGTRL